MGPGFGWTDTGLHHSRVTTWGEYVPRWLCAGPFFKTQRWDFKSSSFSVTCFFDKKKKKVFMVKKYLINGMHFYMTYMFLQGFPGGPDGKESACNAGDPGWIPGLGRIPWRRKWQPIQYSCLENSMDRGTLWTTVKGVSKSQIQLRD